MPKLYVLSGPDVGKSFEVVAGALVGRDAECKVRLRDPSVSRHHARVEHAVTGWSIVDTQSRNGIHVAGKRVPAATLEDGAEFTLGEVLFRFRGDVASAAVPSSAPQSGGAPQSSSAPQTTSAPPQTTGDSRTANTAPEPIGRTSAPVPAVEARAPNVPDEGEIVLEGEWSQVDPTSMAQTTFAAHARPMSQPAIDASAPARPSRPAMPAAEPNLARGGDSALASGTREASIAARTGAPASTSQASVAHRAAAPRDIAVANRGVLQYQRVADRPGLVNADLSQQPLWLKLVLSIAALIVFAAVFWFAFKSTSFLKSKTQHEASDVQTDEDG